MKTTLSTWRHKNSLKSIEFLSWLLFVSILACCCAKFDELELSFSPLCLYSFRILFGCAPEPRCIGEIRHCIFHRYVLYGCTQTHTHTNWTLYICYSTIMLIQIVQDKQTNCIFNKFYISYYFFGKIFWETFFFSFTNT